MRGEVRVESWMLLAIFLLFNSWVDGSRTHFVLEVSFSFSRASILIKTIYEGFYHVSAYSLNFYCFNKIWILHHITLDYYLLSSVVLSGEMLNIVLQSNLMTQYYQNNSPHQATLGWEALAFKGSAAHISLTETNKCCWKYDDLRPKHNTRNIFSSGWIEIFFIWQLWHHQCSENQS